MKKYILTLVTLYFLAITLSGCAYLQYVRYYEPFADSGEIQQEFLGWGYYPHLPDSILFSDIGVEISCYNKSPYVISSGPILRIDPVLTLPIIPWPLFFVPFPYIPKGIMVRIDFSDQIKSIELDPRSIKLLTEDKDIGRPQRIKYRVVKYGVGAAEFVKTLPITEPIVIEDVSSIRYFKIYFEQSARRTSSFVFTIGDLKINNSKVKLPKIVFRKEGNFGLYIPLD